MNIKVYIYIYTNELTTGGVLDVIINIGSPK